MGIAVLGPLTIEGEETVLGRRDRVVLAALAVHPGEVVSAEALADVLWDDQPPATWSKVVQGCVVRLRKLLGSHTIETTPLGYRLAVPLDDIDAQRFERAVGRARELLAADDPERAALVLADALTLWRGRPLIELDGWDPGRIEAARLTELRETAEELYVDSALRSGQHDRVLAKARTLVAEAPLRERRWILLATAQYQSGRQAEALRTLRQLRDVLSRELGLDPGPEIDVLEQAILHQDPSLVVASALPEPSPVCPYRGLQPYDVDDAAEFFGRDADVAAGLRKLADTSVLAVVGPSGCGKSSLVRAGVAAALRRDGMTVVVMTPGVHPVATFATVMPGRGSPPACVVDQCEEVFSLCQDPSERAAFLTALTAHAAVAPLILSFRADRMANVSSHQGFARLVADGMYVLAAMTEPDLRSAIEEPARLASLVVEPGLVDVLVTEIAGQPGALPLMSHALAETWQRREGRTLTVAGYRDTGGIRGAVAQSAERAYERVPAEQRSVLRDLLLRLVTPGPEGEPVRSRLPRRLVVTSPANDAMIDLLVDARLVTSDDGAVELAHESLARAWPRLRGWLDDDLEGQRVLHHLAVAADSWDGLGRPDSELYRGVRLAKALDWQDNSQPTLTATERNFLAASKRLSEAELHAAEDIARRQIRVNRRLSAALSTAAVLLAGALIAGLVAVNQAERADQQATAAQRAATSELARRVGTRALLTEGISHSLLLAAHGARLDDSAETRANLLAAVSKRPLLVRSFPGRGDDVEGISVSPDGRRIVSGDDDARFHLYDAGTGRVLKTVVLGPDLEAPVYGEAHFSPDGRFVVASAIYPPYAPPPPDQPLLRLLDAETLEEVSPPLAFPSTKKLTRHGLAFSADARYLAASFQEGTDNAPAARSAPSFALVWDLKATDRLPRRVNLPMWIQGIALSPDGRILYSMQPLTAYDVATGAQLWRRPDLTGFMRIDVTRDGKLIALQLFNKDYTDGSVIGLVDARTGRTVRLLPDHIDEPRALAFSRDGTVLGSVSHNGEAIVWDAATGRPRQRIKSFEILWGVDFSPDGRTLYTGGDEGIVRAYDLSGQQRYLQGSQPMPARTYAHVLASRDGRRTAYIWSDAATAWMSFADSTTGARSAPVRLDIDPVRSLATWHPDSRHFAAVDRAGVIAIIDSVTNRVIVRRQVVEKEIESIAYVERGNRIAVTDTDRWTTMLDARGLRPSGSAIDVGGDTKWFDWPGQYCCAAVSPDGQQMVLFEHSPDAAKAQWRVIRVATGEVVADGEVILNLFDASFSPDGRRIAVTGVGGELVVIDVAAGAELRAPTTGHGGNGEFVRFSPDGTRIVSGASDGTVSLWDTHTLDLLGTVTTATGSEPALVSPTFTQGNDIVTIAAYDGNAYRWDTRIDRLMDFACSMAGRNLTDEEWTQAFGNRPYEKTCP
ncbi:DNA-binding SARP family transcriptional activator [Kribbella sp. VKM Ac-2527]|uniref:DNA-binding SARP family transcriptional activator n=1 Tax=Kribbella caucasensis TaxID=2512215 RepID=A0A4R6K5L6_9ACTN|nr:BTAD domain-containing putative transcriptional regulator [Kribbella sp. VKM Ac-2527]TDO44617.1 DNA-binding SARP family transcriptional activator [Kribbella sp. VKM Ac-2527]